MLASSRSLTDRYLDAVVRRLPDASRAETAQRLRASIDADVAARVAAGSDPEIAESDALAALGDPDRVAAGVAGRPLHLIGPAVYLDWLRLLKLLLVVAVPAVGAVLVFAQVLAGIPVLEIVLTTLSTMTSVAFGIAFWVTLIFAIIERTRQGEAPLTTWSPDDLPREQTKPDVGIGDLIGGVLAVVLLIGGIIWQATASPFTDADGRLITFLAPELWPWWISYFVAVMLAELAFAVVLYRRRRWTPGLAAVNIALNAAFTVPFVTLLLLDQFVNSAFSAAFDDTVTGLLGQQLAVGTTFGVAAIAFGVAAIAIGDSVDGVVKAVRASR